MKKFITILLILLSNKILASEFEFDQPMEPKKYYVTSANSKVNFREIEKDGYLPITDLILQNTEKKANQDKEIDACISSLYQKNFDQDLCLDIFDRLSTDILPTAQFEVLQNLLNLALNRKPNLNKNPTIQNAKNILQNMHSFSALNTIDKKTIFAWKEKLKNTYLTDGFRLFVNGQELKAQTDKLPRYAQFVVLSNNYRPWVFAGSRDKVFTKTPKLKSFVRGKCPERLELTEFKTSTITFFGANNCKVSQLDVRNMPFNQSHLANQNTNSSTSVTRKALYVAAGIGIGYLIYQGVKDKKLVFSSSF